MEGGRRKERWEYLDAAGEKGEMGRSLNVGIRGVEKAIFASFRVIICDYDKI